MTAQRVQGLSKLTRRHAVKVATAVSVEDCCLAVGEIVGHSAILSASRMNNAMVFFLESEEKAIDLVERGIVIEGEFVSVLPLSLPAKKVTLSNVPPFVSDEILSQALSRYGKLASPIKKMPISSKSPLLKHIVSFRRFVYMVIPDDVDLDLTLNFRIDDFSYTIFVTTGKGKCFGCGKMGHLIRNCPDKSMEEKGSEKNSVNNDVVQDEVVAQETVSTVIEANDDIQEEIESVQVSSRTGQIDPILKEIGNDSSDSLSMVSFSDKQKEMTNDEISKVSVNETGEEAQLEMGEEEQFFKVPFKRKMQNIPLDAKISKIAESQHYEMQETESDSDSSECSLGLSQSESIARSYELEDFRLFLKTSKNKRGMKVQDYFPDLRQFVDKAKILMARDCFVNKEVYRLRKIVGKVNSALKNDAV